MTAHDILSVCMACGRVKNHAADWREPSASDLTHPGRSHGYCSDACVQKHYPDYVPEALPCLE